MSERRASLRIGLIALAVANVMFFLYAWLAPDPRSQAASRIDELQINPARIRLIGSATRGPGGPAAGPPGGRAAYRACLEWGPFAGADAGRAESALGRLKLGQPALQRPAGADARRVLFYVREPDAATVAQIAELQRAFPGTEIKAGPCPST